MTFAVSRVAALEPATVPRAAQVKRSFTAISLLLRGLARVRGRVPVRASAGARRGSGLLARLGRPAGVLPGSGFAPHQQEDGDGRDGEHDDTADDEQPGQPAIVFR